MADLYRKSSLDKLSNPEQLDKMIKISSPLSWLALVAVLLLIVSTIVWSVIGTLPTTETVSGIIVSPDSVTSIYSDYVGVIEKYCVKAGDKIHKGDSIAEIKLTDDTIKKVVSDCDGTITVLGFEAGTKILVGTEIARLTPENMGRQVIVCYVPLAYAAKFEKGMDVLVYPTSIDVQKYGHIEAEIAFVDEYATNISSLAHIFGSGNMVAEQFASNGPIVSIVCKIKTDKDTKSGFYWSSDSAKNLTISSGTVISAKIVVDECAPITKLIGKFKDDMEG